MFDVGRSSFFMSCFVFSYFRAFVIKFLSSNLFDSGLSGLGIR